MVYNILHVQYILMIQVHANVVHGLIVLYSMPVSGVMFYVRSLVFAEGCFTLHAVYTVGDERMKSTMSPGMNCGCPKRPA